LSLILGLFALWVVFVGGFLIGVAFGRGLRIR
jgi:hypothetical protein